MGFKEVSLSCNKTLAASAFHEEKVVRDPHNPVDSEIYNTPYDCCIFSSFATSPPIITVPITWAHTV